VSGAFPETLQSRIGAGPAVESFKSPGKGSSVVSAESLLSFGSFQSLRRDPRDRRDKRAAAALTRHSHLDRTPPLFKDSAKTP